MSINQERNLALHVDYYLPRWMYIYWKENQHQQRVVFDAFYRKNPFKNGYSVFGGTLNIINMRRLEVLQNSLRSLKEERDGRKELTLPIMGQE
ncbi:hypothetical protein [Alkalihalobacterium alkalinitrilicum]|uniref:hypothetical protein n=1 Tax=Alkalihalobacterium alkalinitrilicum TaxID=427920 RepID=UPI001EE3C917|nr:hypothetical protein [Alkalihalobacterium alkalinitrilicum]